MASIDASMTSMANMNGSEDNLRRTLVINGKGGCGKTTVATNLAATFAARGESIALIDQDHQASATDWMHCRDDTLPPIHLATLHQLNSPFSPLALHFPNTKNIQHVVIDAASAFHEGNLETLLRQTDIVLIPVMPSAIDIRTASKFITDLLTHRTFRQRPRSVGLVANRVRSGTPMEEKLERFFADFDLPNVAHFKDLAAYTQAAEEGAGVVDIARTPNERREAAEWMRLADWVDAQSGCPTERQPNPIRATIKERIAAQRVG